MVNTTKWRRGRSWGLSPALTLIAGGEGLAARLVSHAGQTIMKLSRSCARFEVFERVRFAVLNPALTVSGQSPRNGWRQQLRLWKTRIT